MLEYFKSKSTISQQKERNSVKVPIDLSDAYTCFFIYLRQRKEDHSSNGNYQQIEGQPEAKKCWKLLQLIKI